MFSKVILNSKKRVQSISKAFVSFAALTMLLSPISAYGMDPEETRIDTSISTKFKELEALAEAGDAEALCTLGHCYRYGKEYREHSAPYSPIEVVDHAKANSYYVRAVEAGNKTAAAELTAYYIDRRDFERSSFWSAKK